MSVKEIAFTIAVNLFFIAFTVFIAWGSHPSDWDVLMRGMFVFSLIVVNCFAAAAIAEHRYRFSGRGDA